MMAADQQPATASQILEQHGLNGDRLLRIARAAALDAQRRAPSGLGGKYEDLVSFLALQALEAAVKYDPRKSGADYSFSSYLYDVMERRVPDWYRRKSEGFGDSRNGSHDRIVLAGDTIDNEASEPQQPEHVDDDWRHWAQAAGSISTPMADWDHVNERVTMEWARCARHLGITFEEYHRRALIELTRRTRAQIDNLEDAA